MSDLQNEEPRGPEGTDIAGQDHRREANGVSPVERKGESQDPKDTAAVDFLKKLAPKGPWVVTSIDPEERLGTRTRTFAAGDEEAITSWVRDENANRNVYYHVNPTRGAVEKKANRADIVEVRHLHVDVDPRAGEDFDAERVRILARLTESLPDKVPPPTFIVDSGGGYQAIWTLRVPIALAHDDAPREAKEAAADDAALFNLRLAVLFDCDHAQDVSRLLRLPGTTNYPDARKRKKGRMPREARLELDEPSRVYDIAQFDKAAPKPSAVASASNGVVTEIRRVASVKELPPSVPDFTKVVIVQGHDPDNPTRWRSRSEAVFYVVCELVRRGVEDGTILGVLMNEDFLISESVLEKGGLVYARRELARARAEATADPSLAPRVEFALVLDHRAPSRSARRFLQGEEPHLVHYNDDFLRFAGTAYAVIEDATMRSRLYKFLEGALQVGDPQNSFNPTQRKVNEVIDALKAATHAPRDAYEPPCWLESGGSPPREIIACSNGLLHLPTRALTPPTPRFFTRNALDFAYEPDAPPPERWQQFLTQLWPDDRESIGMLQEVFGYMLVPDTSQQKIFLLVGPKRSGKGTVAAVLRHLVGPHNVCGPRLDALGGAFGLESLIGKQLAVVSDMRLGRRTDHAAVTENLLRISGEDYVTVDRKYKVAWHGRLAVRFLILTNVLPKFADAGGALAHRIVPLKTAESFLGREDTDLVEKLLPELPGILLWSIAGWGRLRERGRFVLPESAKETVQTLEDLAAPVVAFVRERCELEPAAIIRKVDLYHAFSAWCNERGDMRPVDAAVFGVDLLAAFPEVRTSKPRSEGNRVPSYAGLRLRAGEPEPF